METQLDKIHGRVNKIIFKKDDYMVGIINQEGEEITFKGNIFGVEKNEEIIFIGKWVNHYKYGNQFEVYRWERPIPKTKDQIVSYLSSPFIKGCGEKHAIRIANALGENAIEIIMTEKENALFGIKGIGKKRVRDIVQSVLETFELQKFISELSKYGINPEHIIKLYKVYGSETLNLLKRNPYILMKYISFANADEIAKRIGLSPLSGVRVEACINYILNCGSNWGHCYLTENELIHLAIKMLNQNSDEKDKVDENEIMQSIFNLEDKTIIIEDGKVYSKDIYTYETKLAQKINILLSSKRDRINDSKLEKYIKDYQLKNGMILGEEQKEAIKLVLKNNLTVLTGGAGTGKTTVVKAIIEIYKSFFPKNNISLSAPTGRASRKLQETTGHFAQTNHRLLGFKQNSEDGKSVGFEFNEDNKLPYDFYIIDEMSMVDLHMAYALTSAMENNAKVLFIGDVNQLPSIGAGNVLKDLLETEQIPKIHLTQIYRQAKNSQIITNSHRVNNGEFIAVDHSKGDMYFINKQSDEEIRKTIIQSVQRFLELGFSVSDILVLSPMKKGSIGTKELNNELQNILNPKNGNKKEVHHGKRTFRVGDKIIQTVNNPDKGIYNGDIGIITDISKEKVTINGQAAEVEIIYSDFQGVKTKHTKDEWTQIELGYSISIHKSQGGQAPIVIIPISISHYSMLARNLIYTGMTRAESKLVLIGQPKALKIGIANNRILERNTLLSERIDFLINRQRKYKMV